MFALIAASLLTQCPGGSCGPSSFVYFQQPILQQTLAPPIVGNLASGKLYAVEIEHADGQRWRYNFAVPPAAQLTVDPSNSNAAVSLSFDTVSKPAVAAKEGPKAQGCANPACCCEDCKCDPCLCGKSLEVKALPQDDASIPNMGIDLSKMKRDGRQHYSKNGGEQISKREALDAMKGEGEGIPDDSKQMFLTTIDTPAECERVKGIVKANPAVFSAVRTKCYLPDDAMVRDKGFVPNSTYLQDAGGKVLCRFSAADSEQVIVGEVNKKRPDYDPNKDPTPNKPGPSPINPNMPNPLASINPLWVLAALIGLALLKK